MRWRRAYRQQVLRLLRFDTAQKQTPSPGPVEGVAMRQAVAVAFAVSRNLKLETAYNTPYKHCDRLRGYLGSSPRTLYSEWNQDFRRFCLLVEYLTGIRP
jgi:hypothetical protein